ncbi:MAG: hypothetical protein IJD60_10635 [Clostridia bacterium]|nr:hypothetical protein [Clostridia bacterium]
MKRHFAAFSVVSLLWEGRHPEDGGRSKAGRVVLAGTCVRKWGQTIYEENRL